MHADCKHQSSVNVHLRRHLRKCGRFRNCSICTVHQDPHVYLDWHRRGGNLMEEVLFSVVNMVTHRRSQRVSMLSSSTLSIPSYRWDSTMSPQQKVKEYLYSHPVLIVSATPAGRHEVVRDDALYPGSASQNEVKPTRAEASDHGRDELGPPVHMVISPWSQVSSLTSESVESVSAFSQLWLSVPFDDVRSSGPIIASKSLAPLLKTLSAASL